METTPQLAPIASTCRSCAIAVQDADQFCQDCGFPLKGNEQDQENFIYNRNYQHLELDSLNKKIKSAGTTLYVLAAVFVVFGFVYYLANEGGELKGALLISNLVVATVFFLLGMWSKKKPVAAIISGLVLYIIVQLLAIIDNPVNIFSGIILKIIIIAYLIKGMKSAFEAERIRKQYNIA